MAKKRGRSVPKPQKVIRIAGEHPPRGGQCRRHVEAPSQAPQTVKTHRASIGRLTARRLAGLTFHLDGSSVRPVAVEHDGPCIRFPGDD
jgi:hypothetical protein